MQQNQHAPANDQDREGWAASGRDILRRVRDVMATGEAAQDRLDRVTRIIADEMRADVCSIYVRRAGDVLELFASKGLSAEAVHQTRLRVGEGIVGHVAAEARPFALADAPSHPKFAYRPETGEEKYHSMMGVPILRGGRIMGVVAVQNKEERDFTNAEVEILETVSMIVAEIIAAGGVVRRKEQTPVDGLATKPLRLDGVKLCQGLAMGRAVLHRPEISADHMVAEDSETEKQRLDEAMSSMHSNLDNMLKNMTKHDKGGDHIEILQAYRMIAEDRGWVRKINEAIDTGLTAEGAVVRVQNENRARMNHVSDPYIRERLLDLEDLAYRLLQHLAGEADIEERNKNLPEYTIIVARNMGPAELLDYDLDKVQGIVLEEGSSTAHVAIVARALNIPIIGRVPRILTRVEPYDRLIVDGNNAICFVRPGEEFRRTFKISMDMHREKQAAYARDRLLPPVTLDGKRITLNMNAGLLIDLPHLHETGASGIGLYRTEVPFMVRSSFPNVEEQAKIYRSVYDQSEGKPVIFRSLDIGGDKVLPYFNEENEENPAMGWRAIRVGIDRPAMLRQQLRAMILAADGHPLKIMFPMIAETSELIKARQALDAELTRAKKRGTPLPSNLEVGIMFEVPSLAFQMDSLLPHIDFISVGTNDLMQFFFASDRGNPRLDNRYDPLNPGFMKMLKMVADKCNEHGKTISVCGEIAGNPVFAMALIGIGIRSLSMSPWSIGPVRSMVRSLDTSELKHFMSSVLDVGDHSLKNRLLAFAKDHNIQF
ncbi:phosphoenolpyruvate--protein phosphotransferase [Curvivirga aplysinae]|uniref:phosphoenolpyruvate--protein phosphotransferase n=1 Tax=Curvivirga aplysinae TaxID=2529852 RepID=UPI001F1AF249|nr:phosphoenolpyruvate--protein phosphotransferase [Curvivirga aplysinae]